MKNSIKAIIILLLASLFFAGCYSEYNENVMYGTVGNSLKKTPPADVTQFAVATGSKSVKLTWTNPNDKDFVGLTIVVTSSNEKAKVPDSISLKIDEAGYIPNNYTFYDLQNEVEYTFTVQTFDKNDNYSKGKSLSTTPSTNLSEYIVENPIAVAGDSFVTLTWENKIFTNFYGIKITVSPAEGSGIEPVMLTNNDPELIPTTYSFYKLNNETNYTFTIQEFDKELNMSNPNKCSAIPQKDINNLRVNNMTVDSEDSAVTLKWTNPTEENFYGIQISASCDNSEASLGTLENPVYFLGEHVPTSFKITGLTNEEVYHFDIYTLDRSLNLGSKPRSYTEAPHKNSIPSLSNCTCSWGDGFALIGWDNPTQEDFYGIKIVYIDKNGVGKQVSFLKDNNAEIPTSYKITGLNNGETYNISACAINNELNESNSRNFNGSPVKNVNRMKIRNLYAAAFSESVTLSWNNPTSPDLYGIMIEADPAEGTLSHPVYFLDSDPSKLPTSYTAYNLNNETSYDFKVYTLDQNMILSDASTTSTVPRASTNKVDVEDFSILIYSQKVKLQWRNPEQALIEGLRSYEITMSPPKENDSGVITLDKNADSFPTELAIDGLTNDISYSFTLRTVDLAGNKSIGVSKDARPNAGSSGLNSNKDLINYKKNYKAYDFGYCTEPATKDFKFVSSTSLDLNASTKKIDSGKGTFTFSFDKATVSNNQDYTLTVTYTPSAYNANSPATASWDEVTFKIGGSEESAVKFIGSNYPQPKNIMRNGTEKSLRLWLRADMISEDDLSGVSVKSLPDYSGNNFHAICSDTSLQNSPIYVPNSPYLNQLPAIDFSPSGRTTSQLVALGNSNDPIVLSEKGITSFVVFYMVSPLNGQTIISSNYGTSFPTLMNQSRYYNKTGFFISNDYKYGLSVKGNNMAGSWRWACISNDTTDDNNRMLVTSHHSTASFTNPEGEDNVPDRALSVCMTFDRTITENKINGDLPSNIRMHVNNDERFLGYIYSLSDGNYTSAKLNNSLLSADGLSVYGSYGKPFGDGKGHRFGSLGQDPKPSTTTATTYQSWKNAALAADAIGRKYDRAFIYTPSAVSGQLKASTGGEDYFENFISRDIWRNGTINTLTVGADYVNASSCFAQVAEVFIFDYALSDEEIETMNKYITYRYNIQPISTDPNVHKY